MSEKFEKCAECGHGIAVDPIVGVVHVSGVGVYEITSKRCLSRGCGCPGPSCGSIER